MKQIVSLLLLPVLFYPVYFVGVNIVDTVIGDQQLVNWLYFDSRSELLNTFFGDWISSLPVMYLVYLVLIKPLDLVSNKYVNSSRLFVYIAAVVIILLISYLVGFREVALLSNAIAIILLVTFYYFFQLYITNRMK